MSPLVDIPNGDPGVTYREVSGHFGYAVGSEGSVWSLCWRGVAGRSRRLSTFIDYGGYEQVRFCHSSVPAGRSVSVLVLESFVGVRPSGCFVNYLDGNRLHNASVNLAWGGRSKVRLTAESVRLIREGRVQGRSNSQMASEFGVSRTSIQHVVSRRSWKHIP